MTAAVLFIACEPEKEQSVSLLEATFERPGILAVRGASSHCSIEVVDDNGMKVAMAPTFGRAELKRFGREAGAMLFDTHRQGGGTAKLVYFYQVEGMTHFHADMAKDGSAFALVETPYRDSRTNKIIGSYRVHIVR